MPFMDDDIIAYYDLPVDSIFRLNLTPRGDKPALTVGDEWSKCVIDDCGGHEFQSIGGFAEIHSFQCKNCGQKYHEFN